MKRIATSCLLALIGCSQKSSQNSQGKVVDPPPPQNDVSIELASVTLADDCGGTLPPPVPAVRTAQAPARAAPPAAEMATPADEPASPAKCAGPHCDTYRPACDQTSMQLAITPRGSATSKISVKKVELLDETGKLVGELAVNQAMRWSEASKYEPWDQIVPAGSMISASYALAAPPYDKIQGGRYEAHDKKFQLRVTIAVEGKDRTVEKKAIAPTMLEPAVPT